MIRKSMKGLYVTPRTYVTAAAPEGLICNSFNVYVQVDELHNMNTVEDSEECFDFEF